MRAALALLLLPSALMAQGVVVQPAAPPVDTSQFVTVDQAGTIATNAANSATSNVVKSVNSAAPVSGNVTVAIPAAYTDAQARTAAQGITSFTNPNITMPNGANISHTIFQSRGAIGLCLDRRR